MSGFTGQEQDYVRLQFSCPLGQGDKMLGVVLADCLSPFDYLRKEICSES